MLVMESGLICCKCVRTLIVDQRCVKVMYTSGGFNVSKCFQLIEERFSFVRAFPWLLSSRDVTGTPRSIVISLFRSCWCSIVFRRFCLLVVFWPF